MSAQALVKGRAEVVVYDDNEKSVAEAKAAGLNTQDLRTLDWSKVYALVLTPGVSLTHPQPHWAAALARAAEVEIIGDIELFCRERAKSGAACPLIAITGTNGKSTTTALVNHLLKSAGRDAQMGGNIGVPALALEPFAKDRAYVLEVSSYQIDLAPSLKPTVGILLNVTEDHLDRHGTMENYAAIKERLAADADTAVIGVDDEWTRASADRIERAGKNVVRVSVAGAAARRLLRGRQPHHARRRRQDAGGGATRRHRLAARRAQCAERGCAIAACLALGLDLPAIQKGLATFPRACAPHAADRPQRQCVVRQRFESDQCRFHR